MLPDNDDNFDNPFDDGDCGDDHYGDGDLDDDDLLGTLSFLQFKRKFSGLLQTHVCAKLHLITIILTITVMTFIKYSPDHDYLDDNCDDFYQIFI